MNNQSNSNEKVLKRSAEVLVNVDLNTAFEFISSSSKLSSWLKSYGKISGCESVDVLIDPYNHPNAKRRVNFLDSSSAVEELISFNPPGNYTYQITDFTSSVKRLSNKAFGQCWFDTIGDQTRIKWDYSFTYKNIFARAILSVILTISYQKFMTNSLENAKGIIDKRA